MMRRHTQDRGAIAVLVALLMTVLLGAAAIGVDLAKLYQKRQALQNAVDAAVTAGAFYLPDTTKALTAAVKYSKANYPNVTPTVSFACIVGVQVDAAGKPIYPLQPSSADVLSACNISTYAQPVPCTTSICVVPCPVTGVCNSIRVSAKDVVPFGFARILGFKSGTTGTLRSTACTGTCGSRTVSPMDVVFVADRTGSMSATDRNLMVQAIKDTLTKMTPSMQFVALGTIHRTSASPGTCLTTGSSSATSGPWVPIRFVNDYLTSTRALSTSSVLVQGLNCLPSSSGGTYLASPMKLAAYYLLNPTALSSSYTAMQTARTYTPTRAIVFETDGQPNETNITGNTSINTSDIGSSDGVTACSNFSQVATAAKAAKILIVTVSFGGANTATCGATGSAKVRDVLAGAASPTAAGVPSAASDCSTTAGRTAENSDGDFFFCAAGGTELSSIFTTAVSQISGRSRIVEEP